VPVKLPAVGRWRSVGGPLAARANLSSHVAS